MITRSLPAIQPRDWNQELREAYTEPLALLRELGIDPAQVNLGSGEGFVFRVPRPYARRMRRGDPADPLLRQVLPDAAESVDRAGFSTDPVGDLVSRRAPQVLQKYAGRALLIVAGACAINCRYCFRRHYPYAGGGSDNHAMLEPIRADASIEEVILSGGDPLLLHDEALAQLIDEIAAIDHVQRLRVHSRLPVTIPARLTPALIRSLTRMRLAAVMVLHINHPNEIDEEVRDAMQHASRAGLQLLNQSVLLRGVNDDAQTLAQLSTRLFDASVLPYYIHLLDPVRGAAHFDVDEATALSLASTLRNTLPGYLVPRFTREIPGDPAKRVLA